MNTHTQVSQSLTDLLLHRLAPPCFWYNQNIANKHKSQQQNNFKTLYGDSKKIFKILSNIVANAYEHTEYGEVKLDIEEKKLDSEYIEVTYTISNSGHTMTDEMFNEDFEQYLYDQNELDSSKIGLSISKKYIELLGGTIEFINKEGQGTKYIVKLRQKNIEIQTSAAI